MRKTLMVLLVATVAACGGVPEEELTVAGGEIGKKTQASTFVGYAYKARCTIDSCMNWSLSNFNQYCSYLTTAECDAACEAKYLGAYSYGAAQAEHQTQDPEDNCHATWCWPPWQGCPIPYYAHCNCRCYTD